VTNQHLGASLAAGFNPSTTLSKGVTAIKNYLTSSTPAAVSFPSCPTVLMRGHGMTLVGSSIEEVVYRSVFTCVNARVQMNALLLQSGYNLGHVAQRFGQGGGQNDGNPGPAKQESVRLLSERECKDSWTTMEKTVERPWALWCKEVEEVGLYQNEVRDALMK
jgi:ribulose-5-phosphate 4-epimerase/fuculose-1-phosphate aldolase